MILVLGCASLCTQGCTDANIGSTLREDASPSPVDAGDPPDAPPPPPPDAASPDAQACIGGDRRTVADGACFFAFETPETWLEARASCVAAGGDLARIDSEVENDAVFALANSPAIPLKPDWWMGGNDRLIEDTWVWLDTNDEIVAPRFENWRLGEPNNGGTNGEDCMILESDNPAREWDDRNCALNSFPYICRR
jgi:hypothetical protein